MAASTRPVRRGRRGPDESRRQSLHRPGPGRGRGRARHTHPAWPRWEYGHRSSAGRVRSPARDGDPGQEGDHQARARRQGGSHGGGGRPGRAPFGRSSGPSSLRVAALRPSEIASALASMASRTQLSSAHGGIGTNAQDQRARIGPDHREHDDRPYECSEGDRRRGERRSAGTRLKSSVLAQPRPTRAACRRSGRGRRRGWRQWPWSDRRWQRRDYGDTAAAVRCVAATLRFHGITGCPRCAPAVTPIGLEIPNSQCLPKHAGAASRRGTSEGVLPDDPRCRVRGRSAPHRRTSGARGRPRPSLS